MCRYKVFPTQIIYTCPFHFDGFLNICDNSLDGPVFGCPQSSDCCGEYWKLKDKIGVARLNARSK